MNVLSGLDDFDLGRTIRHGNDLGSLAIGVRLVLAGDKAQPIQARVLDDKAHPEPLRIVGCFTVDGLLVVAGFQQQPRRLENAVGADEQIDLPWRVLELVGKDYREAVQYQTPYHWAAAYGLMALVLVGLAAFGKEEKLPSVKGSEA